MSGDSMTLTAASAGQPAVSQLDAFSRVGSALLLVICLLLFMAWLFKRGSLKRYSSRLINICASYPITQKDRIVILQVDDRLLVVGVSQTQMTLLHTIEGERAKLILADLTTAPVMSRSQPFHQLLRTALKRGK